MTNRLLKNALNQSLRPLCIAKMGNFFMNKQNLIRPIDFLYLAIFVILTYGMFYYSYKWYGHATDFYYYYELYKAPLSGETIAPFHYRRLTPLLVSMIAQAGIYYPLDINFSDSEVSQRIWFAAILVNYGGILLSAVMAAKITDILVEREESSVKSGIVAPIFAGVLVFFSFLMMQKTLTPMNDGLTWFFTTGLFYAVLSRRLTVFGVLIILGVAHREMIPVIGMTFVFLTSMIRGWYLGGAVGVLQNVRAKWAYLAFSMIGILCYIFYRILDPVSGNEEQLQLITIFKNILDRIIINPTFSKEMLLNAYISQNIFLIFVVLVIRQWRFLILETRVDVLVLLILMPSLYILGYGVGMGSSIGRFGGWLAPCMTPFIVIMMLPTQRHEAPP